MPADGKGKALSFRLDRKLMDDLSAVARVEGLSISDAVRRAIVSHIAELRTDPHFQDLAKKRLEADRKVLEDFSG